MADAAQVARLVALGRALAPARRLNVLDVGANPLGDPPYAPLAEAGLTELVGFEPQERAWRALQAEAGENARFVNAAVGPAGEGALHVYGRGGNSGLTSLYPLSEATLGLVSSFSGAASRHETVPVALRPLDEIDEVPQADLLKIDVQGAELSILQGGRAKLADAAAVIIEMRFFPLYEGEPHLDETHAELRTQGFLLHRILDQHPYPIDSRHLSRVRPRRLRSQLIDGDAVYVRGLDALEGRDDEALKRLALLSCGAWESFDLALRCLDILEGRGAIGPEAADGLVASLPSHLRREAAAE